VRKNQSYFIQRSTMNRLGSVCAIVACLLAAAEGLGTGFISKGLIKPVSPLKLASPARVHHQNGASLSMIAETINVGIIGAGRIGLVHAEALSACPEANLVAISNPTVSKAEAAAKQWNIPSFTGDAMEIITNPEIDAVWICSPSSFHADQIKACAANGKHVFCEKPIATDLPETIEAINACKIAGIKLMTALQRRFDPNFARVKLAIENDEVGKIYQVKLCSRDPSPPPFEYVKGGGGIFKDMAVHDLDMSRFLMGCEPEEILAVGSCNVDESIKVLPGAEAYDTASILLKYEGGKTACIDVCRQAPYGYDQRAEVLGEKGMVLTDNMYPNTAKLYLGDFTGNADMPYDFFMSRYKVAYIEETKAFVDAIVNDKPSPCSGEDGLIALIMAIAAGKSARENRWVKFSELPVVKCDESGMVCELDSSPLKALVTGEGTLDGDWVEESLKAVKEPVLNAKAPKNSKSFLEQLFNL